MRPHPEPNLLVHFQTLPDPRHPARTRAPADRHPGRRRLHAALRGRGLQRHGGLWRGQARLVQNLSRTPQWHPPATTPSTGSSRRSIPHPFWGASCAGRRACAPARGARALERGEPVPLAAGRADGRGPEPGAGGPRGAKPGTLRRLALNLLKREKTKKRGTKGKQKNAGWDHTCLLELLGVEI